MHSLVTALHPNLRNASRQKLFLSCLQWLGKGVRGAGGRQGLRRCGALKLDRVDLHVARAVRRAVPRGQAVGRALPRTALRLSPHKRRAPPRATIDLSRAVHTHAHHLSVRRKDTAHPKAALGQDAVQAGKR